MAYSAEVVQRFENVLREPKKHNVGRFDPEDPNVATHSLIHILTLQTSDLV